MNNQDDVFSYFKKLRDIRKTADDAEQAKADEARRAREEEQRNSEAINEKHGRILTNVVIARIQEVRDRLKSDVNVSFTPHGAHKPHKYGTGVTISFKELSDSDFGKAKTGLYYIKFNEDGTVTTELNSGSQPHEDLSKLVGKTTADTIDSEFVDRVLKLVTSEYFGIPRTGDRRII